MSRRAGLRGSMVAALIAGLLVGTAAPAAAQAAPTKKKELVARILQLQMAGIEQLAQSLVARPAALMLQDASHALERRLAPEAREAAGKRIQDSAKRYVEEVGPLVRARAVKLAPQVFAAQLEADFSEAELIQLVGWLESPVVRKYQQALPVAQDRFMQQLVADARPLVDPRLQKLEQEIRASLGLPKVDDRQAPNAPSGADAAVKKE